MNEEKAIAKIESLLRDINQESFYLSSIEVVIKDKIDEILNHIKSLNASETTKEQPKDKIIVTVLGGIAYCDDPRVEINDLDNK